MSYYYVAKKIFYLIAFMAPFASYADTISSASIDERYLPTDSSTVFNAECAGTTYSLTMNLKKNIITLQQTKIRSIITDLVTEKFGEVFLKRKLYGKISFSCEKNNIRILFSGFEVMNDANVRDVSCLLIIGIDGKVLGDSGLRVEANGFIRNQSIF